MYSDLQLSLRVYIATRIKAGLADGALPTSELLRRLHGLRAQAVEPAGRHASRAPRRLAVYRPAAGPDVSQLHEFHMSSLRDFYYNVHALYYT